MRFLIALALLIPTVACAQQAPSPEMLQAAVMQAHASAEREILATAEVIRLRAELAKAQKHDDTAPKAP